MVWSIETFASHGDARRGRKGRKGKPLVKEAWADAGRKAVGQQRVLRRRKGLELDGEEEDSSTETDSDTDSEPEYTLSIPGGRTMFDENRNPLRRLIWILVALTCFSITVVQVQERIAYYLSTPVRVTVKIELADKLEFPVVTICPRQPFNFTRMEELRPLAAEALQKPLESVTLPFDLVSLMNLTELWTDISQSVRVMYNECFFGRNKSCDDAGRWQPVFTIKGTCFSYFTNESVSETGSFNGLYMILNSDRLLPPKLLATPKPTAVISNVSVSIQPNSSDSPTPKPVPNKSDASIPLGWIMFLHETRDAPTVEMQFGDNVNPKWNLDTQFDGVNIGRNPCVDDGTYTVTECRSICLSRALIQRSQCRLPFMNQPEVVQEAELCNTSESYSRAASALFKMIEGNEWSYGMCDCQRQCYGTYYETNFEAVSGKRALSRLRVFFQDKNIEQVGEELAYDLIGLFCEIGGSVGLLIGASVLTIVELIELGGHSIHVLLKQSAYKKQLKHNVVKRFRETKNLKSKRLNPTLFKR